MTNCSKGKIRFQGLKSRKVEIDFLGGAITSDGGALLLRKIDKKIGLTKAVSQVFEDKRIPGKTAHSVLSMLRQRVFGIALGYEDLNDHDQLRKDEVFQTSVEVEKALASSATLCRFEKKADRKIGYEIHRLIAEQFIASFKTPPKELMLDFDATDLPVYGNQEKKAYHGYYHHHCFLPLHVFCGEQLLVSYLRPCNQDQAKHAWAILSLLVKRLREEWPEVRIIFRADSGFCRHKIFQWCERKNVEYIVGIGGNARLKRALQPEIDRAKEDFDESGLKQKQFTQLSYAAQTWNRERKIIGKAEYTAKGENRRFVVTTLKQPHQEVYEKIYCGRGDAENRIKEQLLLFSGRTSCRKWWSNQLRMLFSALAYILMESLRRIGLKGTKYVRSQVNTLRLTFFKIGGVILKNTRRIQVSLSEYYPNKDLFFTLVKNIESG